MHSNVDPPLLHQVNVPTKSNTMTSKGKIDRLPVTKGRNDILVEKVYRYHPMGFIVDVKIFSADGSV